LGVVADFGVPFNWDLKSSLGVAEAFSCALDCFVRIALSLS
jgi:hypothetical protein